VRDRGIEVESPSAVVDRQSSIVDRFRLLLVPLALLYSLGIRFRNVRYDRSRRAARRVGLPVISIGNLTVGGTGKTPIVIETARRLQELGRRPVILTRGYGAAAGEASDEVREFSEALPDVPVVVNPDRVAGAETARAEAGADCLVLDDGFQHRRLRRDLDVVVVDALDPWGGGWVLPVGRLREPLCGLARAHLFIIARSNQVPSSVVGQIEDVLNVHAPEAPVLQAAVKPESIVYQEGRSEGPESLAYHCALPTCGIGNPATFLRSVEQLAGRVCLAMVFGDHQRYKRRHVRKIIAAAERRGADLVVTTRKDWVKLAPLWEQGSRDAGRQGHRDVGTLGHEPQSLSPALARLDVRLELQDDDGVFDEELRRALERSR
jgi:tetraacyldisaccharide 4'-kinase